MEQQSVGGAEVTKGSLWISSTSLGKRFSLGASQERLELCAVHVPDDSTIPSLFPWLCWLSTTSERCCRHFLVGLCHWLEMFLCIKFGRDPYHPCTTNVCRWWVRQWCPRKLTVPWAMISWVRQGWACLFLDGDLEGKVDCYSQFDLVIQKVVLFPLDSMGWHARMISLTTTPNLSERK